MNLTLCYFSLSELMNGAFEDCQAICDEQMKQTRSSRISVDDPTKALIYKLRSTHGSCLS